MAFDFNNITVAQPSGESRPASDLHMEDGAYRARIVGLTHEISSYEGKDTSGYCLILAVNDDENKTFFFKSKRFKSFSLYENCTFAKYMVSIFRLPKDEKALFDGLKERHILTDDYRMDVDCLCRVACSVVMKGNPSKKDPEHIFFNVDSLMPITQKFPELKRSEITTYTVPSFLKSVYGGKCDGSYLHHAFKWSADGAPADAQPKEAAAQVPEPAKHSVEESFTEPEPVGTEADIPF